MYREVTVFAVSCNWFHRLHIKETHMSVWQFISHWASQQIFSPNRIRCKEEGHLGVLTLKLDLLHLQKPTVYRPNVAVSLSFTDCSECEQNLSPCELARSQAAALGSPASFRKSPRTQTQPPRRSITLQHKLTGTFPFGNRMRRSQLIYNREMSNWARSILIRYTSPAFAFSKWYASPDPESIEVNLKAPPEVGSSHSHFFDLAECWFESSIQNLNIGLPPLLFFFYMPACSGTAQTCQAQILRSGIILEKSHQGFCARLWLFSDELAKGEIEWETQQQSPSEVSISHHIFQGATGFSSTEKMKRYVRHGATGDRDAFWGLTRCCRTSGFCKAPACPKKKSRHLALSGPSSRGEHSSSTSDALRLGCFGKEGEFLCQCV